MLAVSLTRARLTTVRLAAAALIVFLLANVVLVARGQPIAGALAAAACSACAALLCLLRSAWVADGRRDWWTAAGALGLLAVAMTVVAVSAVGAIVTDVLRLVAFPAVAVTIFRVASNRAPLRFASWLDLANAALVIATLVAAGIVAPAFAWGADHDAATAVVRALLPVADATLVALLIVLNGQAGWRPGGAFFTLVAGGLVLTASDLALFGRTVDGWPQWGTWTDAGLPVFAALVAAAAWMTEPRALPGASRPSVTGIALPLQAGLTVVVVLAVGTVTHLPWPAAVLAVVAALGATLRVAVAHAEIRRLADVRVLAVTDDLTELPNRRRLVQALEEALAAGRGGLVVIDLDGFKELNSALGHTAGDALLTQVAAHLRAQLRAGDTAARLGGDEFAIVLPQATAAQATALATRLLRRLAEPVVLDGVTVRGSASAGVAAAAEPATTADAEPLLRRATVALERAKRTGGAAATFDPKLDRDAGEQLRLREDLARGLHAGELVLHLQPVTHLSTGQIVGVEGLVRWNHPTRGLLGPGAFLSVIDGALAAQFSRYVLACAARASAALRRAGRTITVSVNLTAADVLDVALPEQLAQLLQIHGARARDLLVEVTESGVLTDIDRTAGNLVAIRALGVRVALDDFGTGHSQLTHLQRLPVDVLKLDRSFVAGIQRGARDEAIVRAMIALARSMDLIVVGEGVEDAGTWQTLQALRCHLVQGWVLAPALPLEELLERFDALEATARELARGEADAVLALD